MRSTPRYASYALILALALAGCAKEEVAKETAVDLQEPQTLDWSKFASDADLPEHVPGEVVVSSRGIGVIAPSFLQRLGADASVSGLKLNRFRARGGALQEIATVGLGSGGSVLETVRRYEGKDGMIVEPNFIYRRQAIANPNDYFFDPARDLTNTTIDAIWGTFKVSARISWKHGLTGAGVRVAVVDTGIGTHADLNGNVFANAGEIANNGLDDDNNGFIDDVRGWNFVAANNNAMDDNGHGTHVAGTIAAVGDNAIGLPGIAPQAKVVPVKVLAANGSGTTVSVAEGIAYGAMMADVVNLSLGGGASATIDNAVINAVNQGAVVVVAAGNANQNTANVSPARVGVAVTVAATDVNDARANFSNFGAAVDVAAPGVSVLSTVGQGLEGAFDPNVRMQDGNANVYAFISGTSMAAPHVAGIAALLLDFDATLTPAAVQGIIRDSALDLGAAGFDEMFGTGRVRANRAVATLLAPGNAPPTLSVPTSVTGKVGQTVSFTVQATDPESQEVTLSASSDLPQGATFDAATGVLTWTPSSDQAGEASIRFAATDDIESSEGTVVVNVKALAVGGDEVAPEPRAAGVESLGCAASAQDFPSILGLFVLLGVTVAGTRRRNP